MLVEMILKDGAIYAAGVVSSLVLLFIMRNALTYKTTKKDWIMVDFVRLTLQRLYNGIRKNGRPFRDGRRQTGLGADSVQLS